MRAEYLRGRSAPGVIPGVIGRSGRARVKRFGNYTPRLRQLGNLTGEFVGRCEKPTVALPTQIPRSKLRRRFESSDRSANLRDARGLQPRPRKFQTRNLRCRAKEITRERVGPTYTRLATRAERWTNV